MKNETTEGFSINIMNLHGIFMVTIAALVVSLLLSTGCVERIPNVNRNDPESVLRAYFNAWQRDDWSTLKSFMDPMYADMIPEPTQSIHLISVKKSAESTTETVVFAASFQFEPIGNGESMDARRYDWTYDLQWNPARKSWLIVNYGEG